MKADLFRVCRIRQSILAVLFGSLAFSAAQAQTAAPWPSPAISRRQQPRVVLVLGSGGARGLAHVGVLQVLEQSKIPIDLIVGTSAGSIAGALYADNPNAAALRDLMSNATRKDFVNFSLLHILNGPITGKALEQFLQTNMKANDFASLKIPFVAVATDLEKGEAYPITNGPIAPAVHASAALPPYFHSVSLDGRTLVDGGVTAPLAVEVARAYRPQVIIAVNVSGSLPPKMPGNSLSEVARSYSITLDVLEEFNERDANVVITPDVGTNGTFDVSDKEGLFEAGSKAAISALPQIKKVLAEKGIVITNSR
jgi:NTE family protein